jgi:large subunit ribosomal protein L21
MYAVIKTGGKQYRVQPGDLLVVEKLDGEPGADVAFGDVLMLGDGDTVTLGAPIVDGASVSATLIETRKGEKVKIFKKIRRQGYRRTRGHRQLESVLRVTSIAGVGKTDKWDGEVDLTTKAVLNARARGLEPRVAVEDKPAKAAPKTAAAPVDAEADAPKAEAKPKAAPKKAAAPKAEAGETKAAPKKAAAKKESDAE